jgi:hypothetical protein
VNGPLYVTVSLSASAKADAFALTVMLVVPEISGKGDPSVLRAVPRSMLYPPDAELTTANGDAAAVLPFERYAEARTPEAGRVQVGW